MADDDGKEREDKQTKQMKEINKENELDSLELNELGSVDNNCDDVEPITNKPSSIPADEFKEVLKIINGSFNLELMSCTCNMETLCAYALQLIYELDNRKKDNGGGSYFG